uniref:Uncharacterized protein n=1 Tax=Physcomitrium patens TaxID=3218 RepID=A0A2K1IYN9_PHYPA|nr:hypothetical protein PHYPA_024210 [Physcomitrium patens]
MVAVREAVSNRSVFSGLEQSKTLTSRKVLLNGRCRIAGRAVDRASYNCV